MKTTICNECETVAHCMTHGCVPKQPAHHFDEVMYDGSSTAEALKKFQENVQPVDKLIHAWQSLEETSGHVLDENDVEGRMHMSVIRSAWEQMDSLVRDMWEERGRK